MVAGRLFKAQFDSKRLKNATEELITRHDASKIDLLNDGNPRGCRVFVCTTAKETTDITRLQSYNLPNELDIPATICEAALATSAATKFFDPVSIGARKFEDGGLGANNPVDERGKKNKRYREFLQWLWDECVKTILRKIHDGQKPTPKTVKRIWWMGVNLANSLPFHAAGDHSVDSTEQNTLNWAVSSYTPTMKALNHARILESVRQRNARQSELLIVAIPTTPGEVELPGVVRET